MAHAPQTLLLTLLVASLFTASVEAGGSHHDAAEGRFLQALPSAGTVEENGYPLPADPQDRFADFLQREELASAGELATAKRVFRIAQVTDMQLVDDDAPYPMRQGILDEFFGATISGGAERPQEEYGDEILWSMVDVLNAHHALDRFDFVIHTGDNIDNALENELIRYLDILEGTHTTQGPVSGFPCEPDGQSQSVEDDENDVTDSCTSLPEHLLPQLRGLARDLPWFGVYGNHDGLIQGNVPIEPGFQETAAQFGRYFLHEDEFIGMHFQEEPCAGGSLADDFGHGYGFAGDRLCDENPDNDGYYAFDWRGTRLIVLDTVNDEAYQSNENTALLPGEEQTGHDFASGLSEGGIDAVQWQWLQDELVANEGRLVLIFAHHTVNAFYNDQFDPACGPPGCANDIFGESGFVTRDDVIDLVTRYPNIPAFIGGHTHEHRVTPTTKNDTASPGFWNIETSGLLDMPQESRIIEFWITNNGSKGFFALDPIGHTFTEAQQLAASDDQHDAQAARGEPEDQRVLLWFDIPAGVPLATGPQPEGGTGVLRLELLSPQATGSRVDLAGPSNTTLIVQAHDGEPPVPGLAATFHVGEVETEEGATMVIDYATFPKMSDQGNGQYTLQWNFTTPGTHVGTFSVSDPQGLYPVTTARYWFHVPAGVAEEEEESPLPALMVVAALAVAIWVRRR